LGSLPFAFAKVLNFAISYTFFYRQGTPGCFIWWFLLSTFAIFLFVPPPHHSFQEAACRVQFTLLGPKIRSFLVHPLQSGGITVPFFLVDFHFRLCSGSRQKRIFLPSPQPELPLFYSHSFFLAKKADLPFFLYRAFFDQKPLFMYSHMLCLSASHGTSEAFRLYFPYSL